MAKPKQAGITQDVLSVMSILGANADKNFVQRIMSPQRYPVLPNYDPAGRIVSHSSHSMAADIDPKDGNWYVYPTVVQQEDGTLRRLPQPAAFEYARKTGERINFGPQDKEGALWFSSDQGYKQIWDKAWTKPTPRR